jgi:hypothetical protein
MRLRHPSGRIVHLSCGISLDHAEDVSTAIDRLDAANAALRGYFGTGVLTVALRLPYRLAAALADDGRARTRLRAELDARGLDVVTLSGAPGHEGGAADPTDWSDPARVRHTLDLARILVDLLPFEEVRGAIATCGLGRSDEWDEGRRKAGARHLSRLSGGLADLAWITDAGLSVISARISDPATAWQPVLRHLLAADTARTEYVDVDVTGTDEQRGAALAYVLEELTTLGLVPEQQPCTAP